MDFTMRNNEDESDEWRKKGPSPEESEDDRKMSASDQTMDYEEEQEEEEDGKIKAKSLPSKQEKETIEIEKDNSMSGLPFLITQWLSHYASSSTHVDAEAHKRIEKATQDLASVFSDLGAFGSILPSTLGSKKNTKNSSNREVTIRNATYADMKRNYKHLEPSQLECIVKSSLALTQASHEQVYQRQPPSSIVQDSYEIDTTELSTTAVTSPKISIFHPPTLPMPISNQDGKEESIVNGMRKTWALYQEEERQKCALEKNENMMITERTLVTNLESDYARMGIVVSQAHRRAMQYQYNYQQTQQALYQCQRSIQFQKCIQQDVFDQRSKQLECAVAATVPNTSSSSSDVWLRKEKESERVLSLLYLKLSDLNTKQQQTLKDIQMSKSIAHTLHGQYLHTQSSYNDPFPATMSSTIPFAKLKNGLSSPSSVASHIISRQYCGATNNSRRSLVLSSHNSQHSEWKKSMLKQRMSYAVTINCHLFYPVYCLRFDRTGRYFVTGADDQLVKLFQLGAAINSSTNGSVNANARGAILVSTFRGHAGVITDIDVSVDNALLATASEDGDVRIWGLYDGSPVAILRGHTGGANMVSWSVLTPYRLVTTGQDGYAKVWDVRKAALQRYGRIVKQRKDFFSQNISCFEDEGDEKEDATNSNLLPNESEISLPPIPVQPQPNNNSNSNNVIVPPLPPGAAFGIAMGAQPQQGMFVANDALDEGVKLLQKLQHTPPETITMSGIAGSTRSRRRAVKVICLSKCPVGGHFATGSDDGVGRIWAEEEDPRMATLDHVRRSHLSPKHTSNLSRSRHRNDITPMASLNGHINSITDIVYSNKGDRILTASQKDGVIRIWSWGGSKFENLEQLIIRLTMPSHCTESTNNGNNNKTSSNQSQQTNSSNNRVSGLNNAASTANNGASASRLGRPRGTSANSGEREGNSKIQCDVASWTSDDSKIISSQTCQLKATSKEIVPGSHVLYVWDSRTGQCLTGIHSSHTAACPVLVSHPTDASIFASAGGDGIVNVWDLTSGRHILQHSNILQHGPIEPITDRQKHCAYLDGNFSPHNGLELILTDDRGRITIIDISKDDENKNETSSTNDIIPHWMKEQYFANDYYDLLYDTNGYCVERGSQDPPHLAPRAARCNHTGVSFDDHMNQALLSLKGPMPLSEENTYIHRDGLRQKSSYLEKEILRRNGHRHRSKRAQAIVTNVSHATISVGSDKFGSFQTSLPLNDTSISTYFPNIVSPQINATSNSSTQQLQQQQRQRQLSSRYRWSDYDDVLREEALNGVDQENADDDDEEFDVQQNTNYAMGVSSSEDEELSDADDDMLGAIGSNRTARTNRNTHTSSRRRGGRSMDMNNQVNNSHHDQNRSRQQRRRDIVAATTSRQRSAVRNTRRNTSASLEGSAPSSPSNRPTGSRRRNHNRTSEPSQQQANNNIVQYRSSNDNPDHGPYAKDYGVMGHYCIMPKDALVHRKWVSRKSSSQQQQRYTYFPQVGDVVVYIPRAHYDTLEEFPICVKEKPWQSFPLSSSWPVTRCIITAIRYRFPYECYYHGKGHNIKSIVAIITLEVIGYPASASRRSFPWPKPEFTPIKSTRSSHYKFEVSLFESDATLPEFIMPEYLYQWRLQNLEDTLLKSDEIDTNEVFLAYYTADDKENTSSNEDNLSSDLEDPPLSPYSCVLQKIIRVNDNESSNLVSYEESELHLKGSGFCSLSIKWLEVEDKDSSSDVLSTWELTCKNRSKSVPFPPQLTNEETNQFLDILNRLVNENTDYQSFFSKPVDTNTYPDYKNYIEVPMDISSIQERLKNKYYTNKLSVMADFVLMKHNCIKYNGMKSELVGIAQKMCDKFEQMCLENPELDFDPADAMGDLILQENKSRRKRKSSTIVTQRRRGQEQQSVLQSLGSQSIEESNEEDQHDDYDDDNDEEEEEEEENDRNETQSLSSNQNEEDESMEENTSSKQEEQENDDDEEEEEPIRRKSHRIRIHPNRNDAVDEPQSPARRSRSRAQASKPSPNQRTSKRKRTVNHRYKEESEDEFDYGDESSANSVVSEEHDEESLDESDSSEYVPDRSGRKGGRKKKNARKKLRLNELEDDTELPDLALWPENIDINNNPDDLQDICEEIMNIVASKDPDRIFEVPVVEQLPHLRNEYFRTVKTPMDFRTIEIERIPYYNTLRELQLDLILVFRNCCEFNGEKHELSAYARNIWRELNDIFTTVCDERQILLPRRWASK